MFGRGLGVLVEQTKTFDDLLLDSEQLFLDFVMLFMMRNGP